MTTQIDALGRTSTMAYDAGDNNVGSTDPAGAASTYIFSTCLLQAVVDPLGNRTSYTYGRYANKLTQVNALNQVTSWEYDNQGFLTDTVDALGNRTSILYNTARQKIADQDQLGNRTSYSYDNSGRPVSIMDARQHFLDRLQRPQRGHRHY